MNEDVSEEVDNFNEDTFLDENNDLYENHNNKKISKRYILIGVSAAILLLMIIFALPKTKIIKKNNIENQLKEYSTQYFNKYMSINDNTNEYIVTLDMLENANKQGEKYNLKGLEECKKQTTLSKIIVDSKTREIKKIEIEENC